MIKVTISGVQPDELDYSLYEQKLQEITSIKLEYITNLTDGEQFQLENSMLRQSANYFTLIKDLLHGIKDEV